METATAIVVFVTAVMNLIAATMKVISEMQGKPKVRNEGGDTKRKKRRK